MPLSLHPIVGTILLEPAVERESDPAGGDDTSLELLLASLARPATINDARRTRCESARAVGNCRLTWLTVDISEMAVRADLVRLAGELEAALEELSSAGL